MAEIEFPRETLYLVILPDHEKQGKLGVDWVINMVSRHFPWFDLVPRVIGGTLTDPLGRAHWFDVKSGQPSDRARRAKLLRRDLLQERLMCSGH